MGQPSPAAALGQTSVLLGIHQKQCPTTKQLASKNKNKNKKTGVFLKKKKQKQLEFDQKCF